VTHTKDNAFQELPRCDVFLILYYFHLCICAITYQDGAYPHKFQTSHMIKEFIAEFTSLEDGSQVNTLSIAIAGRLTAKRIQGKLLFYDIVGDGMKVQIMSDIKNMEGGEGKFREIHGLLKRGDIVGVNGYPGKSKKGELSIFPTSLVRTTPLLKIDY
jgi:lysyl-tRNA synthetase class 2